VCPSAVLGCHQNVEILKSTLQVETAGAESKKLSSLNISCKLFQFNLQLVHELFATISLQAHFSRFDCIHHSF